MPRVFRSHLIAKRSLESGRFEQLPRVSTSRCRRSELSPKLAAGKRKLRTSPWSQERLITSSFWVTAILLPTLAPCDPSA